MAMLAERKRKQKWCLNPRGKEWSEDQNKFGLKMLQKMGWSHGKGLGSREHGIREHVKIPYKNDSLGLGFKENGERWTEHDDQFNNLLQTLAGDNGSAEITTAKPESLEKKSQGSKVRVHYHKFTRGKDLSRYSAKDLANIFGRKTLTTSVVAKDEEKVEEEAKSKQNDDVDDYSEALAELSNDQDKTAKVKTKKSKKSRKIEDSCGLVNPAFDPVANNDFIDNNFYEETTPMKKNKKKSNNRDETGGLSNFAFDPTSNEETVESIEVDSSPKKKKMKKEKSNMNGSKIEVNDSGLISGVTEINLSQDVTTTIKNKKKSKKNRKEEDVGLNNPAFDPTINNNGVMESKNYQEKKIIEEAGDVSLRKKKLKKTRKEDVGLNNPAFDPTIYNNGIIERNNYQEEERIEAENEEIDEVRKKKLKKNKEDKDENCLGFDPTKNNNNNTADNVNNYQEETIEGRKTKKSSKKKNNKEEDPGLSNLGYDDEVITNGEIVDSSIKKIKKKKSKKNDGKEEIEDQTMGLSNPAFDPATTSNGMSLHNVVENEYEVTPKEKKRSCKSLKESKDGLSNPAFDLFLTETVVETNNNYELERLEEKSEEKKNGRKKRKSTDQELNQVSTKRPKVDDNPDENIEQSNNTAETIVREEDNINDICDITLNVTATPIIKKTPSIAGKSGDGSKRKSVRFSKFNEQRIIPNNADLRNDSMDKNVNLLARKLDGFEAEIENDMNEAKANEIMIGRVGAPPTNGDHERLENGVLLKFKHAKFTRQPVWRNDEVISNAKKAYKHLIKGDILVQFNNTNLHEVKGYGVEKIKSS